ncbi:unnamed protein product [Dibothriocephalus latus]|uniref:Uncharacterized protein n=1 Tax=Dibothriocephalus latus TaxID=60516 RepID=A0A3P7LP85_DIBLA|nr:unnamed protein product [Dibothriocephalus latus]
MKPGNQRPETSDSKSQKAQDRKRVAKGQSRPGLVQDSEQNRLVDNGFCLSMHQPWASLLPWPLFLSALSFSLAIFYSLLLTIMVAVMLMIMKAAGIVFFRDEGRTWYSAHRGPLWIAAAAKVPEDFEIQAVEEECLSHGFTWVRLFLYIFLIHPGVMLETVYLSSSDTNLGRFLYFRGSLA